jgi:hypothetical protein
VNSVWPNAARLQRIAPNDRRIVWPEINDGAAAVHAIQHLLSILAVGQSLNDQRAARS